MKRRRERGVKEERKRRGGRGVKERKRNEGEEEEG